MKAALEMARQARAQGAVPVGAVVVHQGRLVAQAYNDMPTEACAVPGPLQHAEILAMAIACRALGVRRLDGCHLYVTLEPCPLCWGALTLMRVSRVVYGAPASPEPPVEVEVLGGILEREGAEELAAFFRERRRRQCGKLRTMGEGVEEPWLEEHGGRLQGWPWSSE